MATNKQFKDKDGNDITDTNAVHKTGDETIDGNKTFQKQIIVERTKGSNSFMKVTTNFDKDSTDEEIIPFIKCHDKNLNELIELSVQQTATGTFQLKVKLLRSDKTTLKTIVLAESD